MIDVACTDRPEYAANLLLGRYRHVLIQAHYDNLDNRRIRFRADAIDDARLFFAKVPSQIRKWRERGGILLSWRRVDEAEGPHDALLLAECPKSMEEIYRASMLTRHLIVIYEPPTWRAHEETVAKRHAENNHRYVKRMERLRICRDYVEALPVFNRAYLVRRPLSPKAASQPSCAPGSPGGAAPPAGTTR